MTTAPQSPGTEAASDDPLAVGVALAGAQAAALAALVLLLALSLLAILVGSGLVAGSPDCAGVPSLSGRGIPPVLLPIYEAAAGRYSLGARGAAVLAAINAIETSFGRDLATSRAGAVGWMQFEPDTWARYGVDANGDGRRDPSDPWDAIFAAASYLRANGAPRNWRTAIFAYNHAAWYVRAVLGRASAYAAGAPPDAPSCADAPQVSGRLARLVAEANRIDAMRSPYVYGGGHVTPAPATPPWDCSAAWSRLLQVAGYRIATLDSTGFEQFGDPGPGRHVTLFATPAHVYGTIDGHAWGTGDGNPRNPSGGPAWLPHTQNPVAGFPGGTPVVRHPPGL